MEADKHNAELVWLDSGVNYFACKLRCPQQALGPGAGGGALCSSYK